MDSVGKPMVGAACLCSMLGTLWRLEALVYQYNIARTLRREHSDALSLSSVGGYVFVVGKAVRKDGSQALVEAEQSKQRCLYYETTLLRVIDSITRSKQSGSYSRNQAKGASVYSLTGLTDLRPSRVKNKVGLGTELESAHREVKEEILSCEKGEVEWVVTDTAGWKAIPHAFDGDQRYYKLRKVHEVFEETRSMRAAKDLQRTIGYKRVERCLMDGQDMVLLGEVSDVDKGEQRVHISPAKSSSMFDVFTRRRKPFLISTKPVPELLSLVERDARCNLIYTGVWGAATVSLFRLAVYFWAASSHASYAV